MTKKITCGDCNYWNADYGHHITGPGMCNRYPERIIERGESKACGEFSVILDDDLLDRIKKNTALNDVYTRLKLVEEEFRLVEILTR